MDNICNWYGLLGVIHGIGSIVLTTDEFGIEDPFLFLKQIIIYVFVYWVVIRYIFQKIPILNIRALLLTPLRKSKIIRYAMNRTIFSIFNMVSFFYLIPFSIMLVANEDL